MKTIVIGITGSISAFKTAQLVSNLSKKDYNIEVIMTENATKFITPMTFESLIKKPVIVDLWSKQEGYNIKHIEIASRADVFIIAPASANTIAKVANGIADDMLSSTFLAATCPKLIAPAMNVNMYNNPVTQHNLELCRNYGYEVIEPDEGYLACGTTGKGKLPDVLDLEAAIERALTPDLLKGKNVLVTAGPTIEALDPVRYITNHSSGKMGYAIAKEAYDMKANVTLITGPTSIREPKGIKVIHIQSARDMFEAVKSCYEEQDYIIKAAAVGDYRASTIADNKIKKNDDTLTITLEKNPDILQYLGDHKTKQTICGFAMETQDLLENASKKLKKKNCDLLIANNLKDKGAGFKTDTNKVLFIYPDHNEEKELMLKTDLAKEILLTLIDIKEN